MSVYVQDNTNVTHHSRTFKCRTVGYMPACQPRQQQQQRQRRRQQQRQRQHSSDHRHAMECIMGPKLPTLRLMRVTRDYHRQISALISLSHFSYCVVQPSKTRDSIQQSHRTTYAQTGIGHGTGYLGPAIRASGHRNRQTRWSANDDDDIFTSVKCQWSRLQFYIFLCHNCMTDD